MNNFVNTESVETRRFLVHVSVKLRGEGEIPGTPEQFHSPTRPSRRALESTLMAYPQ